MVVKDGLDGTEAESNDIDYRRNYDGLYIISLIEFLLNNARRVSF